MEEFKSEQKDTPTIQQLAADQSVLKFLSRQGGCIGHSALSRFIIASASGCSSHFIEEAKNELYADYFITEKMREEMNARLAGEVEKDEDEEMVPCEIISHTIGDEKHE